MHEGSICSQSVGEPKNRSRRTGYKIVRALLKNGQPTGDYEAFLTGFVIDSSVWARPVFRRTVPGRRER
jgi:glucose/arabinose dehydrogenase